MRQRSTLPFPEGRKVFKSKECYEKEEERGPREVQEPEPDIGTQVRSPAHQ